jgi:hypothetical protein
VYAKGMHSHVNIYVSVITKIQLISQEMLPR